MTIKTIPPQEVAKLSRALPFWMSLVLLPLAWLCAMQGGWVIALLPLVTWFLFTLLDAVLGLNLDNADLNTSDNDLFLYRLVTILWVPLQCVTVFGLIWYVTRADHLDGWERFWIFFGLGVVTGTVGINYAHELMHQRNAFERWLADILLAMVLYSHFRSEHLLVHHRYVGTPRDSATAMYNEGFHRFYPRVLRESLRSAFRAEKEMLARRGQPWTNHGNPFWRFWILQGGFMLLALILGGISGLLLFLVQAGVAIWHLELVNYVEHYGLTRKHLGQGKYEHVQPRHSWNAAHRASNWILINLQRHSDHHHKPDRRFPMLQNHGPDQAPQLPCGYFLMTMAAMVPPLWRRIMNPRVRQWRSTNYPEITNWQPYNKHATPSPR